MKNWYETQPICRVLPWKYHLTPCQLITQHNFLQRLWSRVHESPLRSLQPRVRTQKQAGAGEKPHTRRQDWRFYIIEGVRIFENLDMKHIILFYFLSSRSPHWCFILSRISRYWIPAPTSLAPSSTSCRQDRWTRANWSRAPPADALFFKSIPPHPRKSCIVLMTNFIINPCR